jgi:hypothetical protein
MASLRSIPEVAWLESRHGLVRIPPELDVPLTDRVRQLVDAPEFRRLARISQLGLVSLVYPAAIHTRFEHSLGVYRLALLYLRQLAGDERFHSTIDRPAAELFIVAALLHDRVTGPFVIRSRTSTCPKCPATNCSPTVSCWKGKRPTRSARTGAFNLATWWAC